MPSACVRRASCAGSFVGQPSEPFVVALWSSSGYAAKRDVTVTRDSVGIPHIVAKDFRSLGYGEGYSYAEDNLCVFADMVVTLRAQRAKYFGPDALSYVYASATDPNIKSDFFWQRIRDSGVVRRLTTSDPHRR